MTDTKMLRTMIDQSGKSIVSIADESGILRKTLYNKLEGKSEFKSSEIVSLAKVLGLTAEERDEIFLQ